MNTHGPTLLTSGTDHWAEVRDKCEWYCALNLLSLYHFSLADNIISGPLFLSDHAVTVFTYLAEYKNLKEDEMQDHCSFRFICYLLTTCWRNMFRRITSLGHSKRLTIPRSRFYFRKATFGEIVFYGPVTDPQTGKPLLSSETALESHLLVVTALKGFCNSFDQIINGTQETGRLGFLVFSF